MLLRSAFVLMAVWLAGVVGLYEIGDLVHAPLLAGLTLLLLGVLRARDAAASPPETGSGSDDSGKKTRR